MSSMFRLENGWFKKMNRRCIKCDGTGWEYCEVHDKHKCTVCDGKGCIGDGIMINRMNNIIYS